MAARKKSTIFRVVGLPRVQSDTELDVTLKATIEGHLSEEEQAKIHISTSIAPSCSNDELERIGLVEFDGEVPCFLNKLVEDPLGNWQIEMGDTDISFDRHLFGFTQLYAPNPAIPITAEYVIFLSQAHCSSYACLLPFSFPFANLTHCSIIAITGLDGHAYGSWRGKGNLRRRWLRDFLSKDLPSCRTMVYGYNSKLSSHGIDTIMDYGREFLEELKKVRYTEEVGTTRKMRP